MSRFPVSVTQLMLSCERERIFSNTILLAVYFISVFYVFFFVLTATKKITFFDVQKLVLLGVRG